ncbi:MAG: methyltransferase domain-containing protein, partial [Gammaproteobacteria bacterium]|nr:methyltransferase domain-containing protein [Gammaproteobacteria bacterium]
MPGAGRPQAAGGDWDPAQYDRFRDFRLRPALELLDRVSITRASLVYDLGCGAGTITRIVADRFPGALVVGLDRSPRMLAKARAEPSRV